LLDERRKKETEFIFLLAKGGWFIIERTFLPSFAITTTAASKQAKLWTGTKTRWWRN